MLARIDLALADRLVGRDVDGDLLAAAQRALDGMRRPSPTDAQFVAATLRLRGFVIDDDDAEAAIAGRSGRLSPISQEYRLLRGMHQCLRLIRQRASQSMPPDGWFLVELFRVMTAELPRFRNNDLRRSPPWDALLYINYPKPDQLRFLIDSFDHKRCYRDAPIVFHGMHPVRQGFRMMWRFARIAPFPDFNAVVAWLGLNAWLQSRGFPLLCPERGDQEFLTRLLSGPPPTKIVQFEARLLAAFEVLHGRDAG
ncbi:MAG: hypothetical protein H6835_08855 [Planctomycetes bacterium]|nr:hypothetical protein [Planctomycetota bacterium]